MRGCSRDRTRTAQQPREARAGRLSSPSRPALPRLWLMVTAGSSTAPPPALPAFSLRPGGPAAPIRYVVYRIRDGRTFTTRDVVAYQSGEAIFNVSCSFTRPEEGVSKQEPMPDVP